MDVLALMSLLPLVSRFEGSFPEVLRVVQSSCIQDGLPDNSEGIKVRIVRSRGPDVLVEVLECGSRKFFPW